MKSPLALVSALAFAMAAGASLLVWANGLGVLLAIVFVIIAGALLVSRDVDIEDAAYDLGLDDGARGVRR